MSILLALLRSPSTSGTQRPRKNEAQEYYTEMRIFNRSSMEGTELRELSSVEMPSPVVREVSIHMPSPMVEDELQADGHSLNLDHSFCVFAAAELTFVFEVLSPGASFRAKELVQEAFKRLCWSGSVLCKLLSAALPGSLDERAINSSDSGNLTAEDVLENFRLCHSCAHAQGCDVKGLTVEQLYACEVSCLTDFVLEVLRLSAVQALPVPDRQVLAAPPPQATGPGAAAAAGKNFRHLERPELWPSPGLRDGQTPGNSGEPQVPISGSSGSSRRGSETGNCGAAVTTTAATAAAEPEASKHTAPPSAPVRQPGTAAARRALAGLEFWALHLVGAQPDGHEYLSSDASSEPSTPATVPGARLALTAAPGPPAQLSPGAAEATPTTTPPGLLSAGAAALAPRSRRSSSSKSIDLGDGLYSKDADWRSTNGLIAGGGVGASVGTSAGVSLAAAVDNTVAAWPIYADPLRLEVWERLATILSQLDRCGSRCNVGPDAGAAGTEASGPEEVTKGSGTTTRGSVGVLAAGEVLGSATPRPKAAAAAGLRVRVPRAVDDERDEEARWAAAAQALSTALANVSDHGPLLPALRAEHLQCRHPGLRSLLLVRALLAHCQLRRGATTAVADATCARVDGECSSNYQLDSGEISPDRSAVESASKECAAMAAAAVAVAAAAAAKMLPASPAPPLPPLRAAAALAGGPIVRKHYSSGGRPPMDLLSEHNLLVQKEHQQREMRRQQRQQRRSAGGIGGGGDADGDRPRASTAGAAAAEAKAMLWGGDGHDDEGADQEERVLRLWLNSLDPGINVTSVFDQEITTGWPLLLALEAIQPGCVPWSDTFRPPFKEKLRKILSVQNCNLVIEVCTRQLAMPPLVNIGGLDLALGQRRATLSLVFQMMRHHMGMLLGLAAPPPSASPHSAPAWTATAAANAQQHHQPSYGLGCSYSLGHDASPHFASHQAPHAPSPQRGSRAHGEVEKAVLSWANAKLTEAAVAAAATAVDGDGAGEAGALAGGVAQQLPFVPLASFSDKRLGEGSVLLQLLAAICPSSVNPKYALPGRNAEERGSNARYLLSCARKLGCVIFLGWEDVVAARPNLLLLLLASFMALDRKMANASPASETSRAPEAETTTTTTTTTAADEIGAAATVGPGALSVAPVPAASPQ